MMKHTPLTFILLVLLFLPVTGQEIPDTIPPSEKISFAISNINFVKDDEYSNPVIEGYTLIGYFLHPRVVYRPSGKLAISLGAHLLSYSGTNKFSQIKPVFSTTLYLNSRSYLNLGSLFAVYKEGLFDPHFNSERLYTAYSDDGIQVRLCNDHVVNDTWVSWENFIFKGDTDREVFTAGESFRYSSAVMGERVAISIPLQILFKHYGGQISNYPQEVETYMNAAGGIIAGIGIGSKSEACTGIELLAFAGSALTKNAPSGINKGHGEWGKIFFTWRGVGINAGYWSSHDFYAPEGNFIFSSVSDHLDNVIIHSRKILTGSASLSLLPERYLKFYFAVDGYYDVDLKRLDSAFTLHLIFDRLFRLAALKPL
jgi:hypothetical protein